MAAPANKSLKDLNGKWLMNKTLSDSPEAVLALQGIGWMTRKAVGLATVTQHITQQGPSEENPSGPAVPLITVEQTATGGIKGTTENRTLDWTYRAHSDWLFGEMQAKSRFTTFKKIAEESAGKTPEEADAKFLSEGWLPETLDGEVVESFVDNEKGKWTAWQIWGFAEPKEKKGERWFTRKFVVRRKDKDEAVKVTMAYEWLEG
ncbi:unnamed protein product [Periconia digitata]|uniref:Uncharacterized protein n=1 Tax=Periconia digitata TaxID=1303443 RepID=A0A9W4XL64_9PLEO|nr:unnamed protein product [Periconia digitata]